MAEILVVYYSRQGATAQMAQLIARGVGEVSGATARVRTVLRRARRPVGNVTIANSDAGWAAYAHAAIDQAHRAVNELKPT